MFCAEQSCEIRARIISIRICVGTSAQDKCARVRNTQKNMCCGHKIHKKWFIFETLYFIYSAADTHLSWWAVALEICVVLTIYIFFHQLGVASAVNWNKHLLSCWHIKIVNVYEAHMRKMWLIFCQMESLSNNLEKRVFSADIYHNYCESFWFKIYSYCMNKLLLSLMGLYLNVDSFPSSPFLFFPYPFHVVFIEE